MLKKIVTGGTGMTGSCIVNLFIVAGHEVVVIANLSTYTVDHWKKD